MLVYLKNFRNTHQTRRSLLFLACVLRLSVNERRRYWQLLSRDNRLLPPADGVAGGLGVGQTDPAGPLPLLDLGVGRLHQCE